MEVHFTIFANVRNVFWVDFRSMVSVSLEHTFYLTYFLKYYSQVSCPVSVLPKGLHI